MSAENRAYTIRNIIELTKAAEFRCQNCQFERTLCPAGKNFSSGKILPRRPRIIRGLYLNKEPLVATCFYHCDALSLRNDTIHICYFCACTQKKITDVHTYPDETDSRPFNKLLRYLNVATVIHNWCVLEH